MSTIGYNGNEIEVELNSEIIAAINSKSITMTRTGVEVPRDTDDGWMRILPRPGRREVNASIEMVCTSENLPVITDEWEGDVLSTITLRLPDGRTMTAGDGFFLGDVEIQGEEDGFVALTANIRSSGVVTIAAAPA